MISERNRENNGRPKDNLRSFKMDPPNMAIAMCGANPQILSGMARYKAAAVINRQKVRMISLFDFMHFAFRM